MGINDIKIDLAKAVPELDRVLLIQALDALKRERRLAYDIALDIADRGKLELPTLESYGIKKISELSQKLGGAP